VICLEMMKKIQDAGFRIAEVPVHHYHRAHGKSQFFNFRRLFRTVVDVAKLWYVLVIRREHLRPPSRAAVAGPASARQAESRASDARRVSASLGESAAGGLHEAGEARQVSSAPPRSGDRT
jgi:hypothetical protein